MVATTTPKKPAAPKAKPTATSAKPAAPKKTAPKAVSGSLTVQQYASPLRRHFRQGLHLKGLGLGKLNAVRTLPDTPSVRGLIDKVKHMVRIVR